MSTSSINLIPNNGINYLNSNMMRGNVNSNGSTANTSTTTSTATSTNTTSTPSNISSISSTDIAVATAVIDGTSQKQKSRRVWTPEEDEKLRLLVSYWGDQCGKNGHWDKISSNFDNRSNKDCRKRWFHSLDPKLKRGRWTEHEDKVLIEAYKRMGPVWHRIAQLIPGRTDDQCSKRYNDVLDPKISDRLRAWSVEEDAKLLELVKEHGTKWRIISNVIEGRTGLTCRNRWRKLITPSLKENAKAKLVGGIAESEGKDNGQVLESGLQGSSSQSLPSQPSQPSQPPNQSLCFNTQPNDLNEDSDVLMSNDSSPTSTSSISASIPTTNNTIGNKNPVLNQLSIPSQYQQMDGAVRIPIQTHLQPQPLSHLQPQPPNQHQFQPSTVVTGPLPPSHQSQPQPQPQPHIQQLPQNSTSYTFALGDSMNIDTQDTTNSTSISYRDLETFVSLAAKSGQKIIIHQHNHYHYHSSSPTPTPSNSRPTTIPAPPSQPQSQSTTSLKREKSPTPTSTTQKPLVETLLSTNNGTSSTPTPSVTTPGTFLDLAVIGNDNFIFDEADLDFDLDEFHGIPFNPS